LGEISKFKIWQITNHNWRLKRLARSVGGNQQACKRASEQEGARQLKLMRGKDKQSTPKNATVPPYSIMIEYPTP